MATKKKTEGAPERKSGIKCVSADRKFAKLSELGKGETFRFPAGANSGNVYLVLSQEDIDFGFEDDRIGYTLVGTGQIYFSPKDKEIVRVKCELSYTDVE